MIQLIIGLGNPGSRYVATRHNVGSDFLVKWAKKEDLSWKTQKNLHADVTEWWLDDQCKIIWAVPTTYMNESGRAVQALMRYYNISPESLLILHDELDLPTGSVRLKLDGGHGGHNGLRSIFQHIGSQNFYRMRFGIGRPEGGQTPVSFVLTKPSLEEAPLLARAEAEVLAHMPCLLRGDEQDFMNHIHTLL